MGTWVWHVQHEGHHVEQDICGDKLLPVLDSVIAKQNHIFRYSRLRNELLHELAGLPANCHVPVLQDRAKETSSKVTENFLKLVLDFLTKPILMRNSKMEQVTLIHITISFVSRDVGFHWYIFFKKFD